VIMAAFYQHQFATVEEYVHHRAPYLLVDRIVTCTPTEVVTEHRVGDEFFLPGHFPGAPIFPGAMMQELSTQSAGVLIAAHFNPMPVYNTADPFFNEYALGVLVRVSGARYRSFARPGDTLVCRVELVERVDQLFDFRGSITVNSKQIMRNSFQLTNIKSAELIGGERASARS
jgi:3-hydroxyacyl-[acyl-carrier-protein] dehydratase